MSLKKIKRMVSARNEGELLLVQISEALNDGDLPNSVDIESLDDAVTAMLAEDDPQQRLLALQRRLGLLNPEGRPPADTKHADREKNLEQARAYWYHRFMGESKTEARSLAAVSCGCSIDTIKRKVKAYPKAALLPYQFCKGLDPDIVDQTQVRAEIKELLTQAKTS